MESMIKSLHKIGMFTASRTLFKSSIVPWKKGASVNTEIALAPLASYTFACCAGSTSPLINPFEGEARLINGDVDPRSEEHTSELQSRFELVCRLLLQKKKNDVIEKASHYVN